MADVEMEEIKLSQLIEKAEEALVNPVVGIIQRLVEIPIEPNDPRLFLIGTTLANTPLNFGNKSSMECGGAGLTRLEAKAAAIGESVERYCFSFIDRRRFILGSFRQLSNSYSLLHPSQLPLFHPTQYEQLPYSCFTEETKLAWINGISLITGEETWVPSCLVHYGYYPADGEEIIGPAISTGLACDFSYEEALLKGICEVIERDAFTIMWENQLSLPHVQIDSDPYLSSIYEERLRRHGLSYTLINMELDFTIPCMFASVIDERETPPFMCVGAAAYVDFRRSAQKALIEAIHTLFYARYLLGKYPDKDFKNYYTDIEDFQDHVLLYTKEDMLKATKFLSVPKSTCSFGQITNSSNHRDVKSLRSLLKLFEEKGMDVIAVDLTTSDVNWLGFRVVKVLIPGMQALNGSHRERFLGNSRLYEVPYHLGLIRNMNSIESLNYHPHPFP